MVSFNANFAPTLSFLVKKELTFNLGDNYDNCGRN
ncbi:MAG: hypothetical protein MRERC_3c112 [Mycoplasmataceae bacterium RC_NB112A]|nr:MAG: hypothetical protein MRERC_12c055 [Mycoplasmataceae bacterium RC_NB112A]KLL02259.1 MAG: hypothetical protein MRERC_3c112 [Mycoplasmataceae bacterium RC_NB112A]